MVKQISIAELNDILALVAFVEFEEFDMQNTTHKNWIKRKLDRYAYSGAIFFGCYNDDNSLIGFATISIEDRPAEVCNGWGCCELLQIGINEEYRNHGYGSELMSHITAYLTPKNVYSLYVHTYAQDKPAILFYLKNGFVPAGTVPNVYGPEFEGMLYLSKKL